MSESSGMTKLGALIRDIGAEAMLPDARDALAEKIGGYTLDHVIARGGMSAAVYLGKNDAADPPLAAVKVLPELLAAEDAIARRFRREVKVMQGLDHPNIVRLITSDLEDEEHPYIVMNYVDGGSLADRLKDGEAISRETAVEWIASVASAVGVLHRAKIIHRDIKPGNILLTSQGVAKLADFGLAKFQQSSSANPLTRSGETVGTLAYMSPEQLAGGKVVRRTDIYALGAVLYQLLTGQIPAGNIKPPSEINPKLWRYDEVIARATDNDPGKRFETSEEFADALREAHASKDPWLTRRRVIGMAGTLGIGAAWGAFKHIRNEPPFWRDIRRSQLKPDATGTHEIELETGDDVRASFRVVLSTSPASYRVEATQVPETWALPIEPSTVVNLRAPLGVAGRGLINTIRVAVPPPAKAGSSVLLANLPNPTATLESFGLLVGASDLLGLLESVGALRKERGVLYLDAEQCPHFPAFAELTGMPQVAASAVSSPATQAEALMKIGFYQLLRHPSAKPHPAFSDEDFSIIEITTRSRLNLVAALIAEPWLLARQPASNDLTAPIYDSRAADAQNQAVVALVDEILRA